MNSKCPFQSDPNKLRADLPTMPRAIAKLPVDPERGYPIPWFVPMIDGKPEFRLADADKYVIARKENRCWCCGSFLGHYKSFVIGPMCCINRISADPPNHLECAEWSVKACPFLSRPNMVRREDALVNSNNRHVAGIMIERNPGVELIWTTRTYRLVPDPSGKSLFGLGDPISLSWWKESRPATRIEVMSAIDSGLPLLRDQCDGTKT